MIHLDASVALLLVSTALTTMHASCVSGVHQIPMQLVDRMPNTPEPWVPIDWVSLARNQTALIFNLTQAEGVPFTPLLWWDDTETNFPQRTFGIPSYVGEASSGQNHEEIAGGKSTSQSHPGLI